MDSIARRLSLASGADPYSDDLHVAFLREDLCWPADLPSDSNVAGDDARHIVEHCCDGGKRKKGSNIHMVVDTLNHLLALHATPASAENRSEVERLARTGQAVTDDQVEIASVVRALPRRTCPIAHPSMLARMLRP
ncbi:hypothetical protein NDN01_03530 [Sphingomonas sp. QA11]|uniref:hypothetical protein n=1 Tax=Sphingomonas sp. QA11 TaxID=2950605 RepID=UPI0023498227|nr:hypothetical protein [Sphingomonas sp. QA11]WCM28012.1 hypothetical protein NDN01_03530 [Sphingomonas sp. QA11]